MEGMKVAEQLAFEYLEVRPAAASVHHVTALRRRRKRDGVCIECGQEMPPPEESGRSYVRCFACRKVQASKAAARYVSEKVRTGAN